MPTSFEIDKGIKGDKTNKTVVGISINIYTLLYTAIAYIGTRRAFGKSQLLVHFVK